MIVKILFLIILDARLAEIAKRLHEEKLMDFAKVDDPEELENTIRSQDLNKTQTY